MTLFGEWGGRSSYAYPSLKEPIWKAKDGFQKKVDTRIPKSAESYSFWKSRQMAFGRPALPERVEEGVSIDLHSRPRIDPYILGCVGMGVVVWRDWRCLAVRCGGGLRGAGLRVLPLLQQFLDY